MANQEKIENELKKVQSKLAKDEAMIAEEEKEIKKLKFEVRELVAVILIILAIGGAILSYLTISSRSVYIEKSDIEAPEVALSSSASGILNDMFVKAGDVVVADQIVARVGDNLVKTKTAGIITKADNVIGKSFSAGQTVVTMIDPTQLRVVGHLEENKGLDQIRVGQYVKFSVDAFGSKEYSGVVDQISPEARSGDIVFTISDARQEQVFDIKVRFDTKLYPELKDGMSARIWVSVK